MCDRDDFFHWFETNSTDGPVCKDKTQRERENLLFCLGNYCGFAFSVVLGTEPGTLHMLSKCLSLNRA